MISFSLSMCMAINSVYFAEHRGRIYQQLLFVLAAFDLFKSGSWLIGTKYGEAYYHCAVQEYMFQFGALGQALVTVMICAIAVHTVRIRKVPNKLHVAYASGFLFFFLIVCISLSIGFKTAGLFCQDFDNLYQREDNDPKQIIVYLVIFVVTIYICIIVDIVCYVLINHKISMLNLAHQPLDSTSIRLETLVQRLKVYPIIFVFCYIINTASFIISISESHFMVGLGYAAAAMIASSGSLIALNYFYHQKLLAPAFVLVFKHIRNSSNRMMNSSPFQSDVKGSSAVGLTEKSASSGLVTVDVTSTVASEAELISNIPTTQESRNQSRNKSSTTVRTFEFRIGGSSHASAGLSDALLCRESSVANVGPPLRLTNDDLDYITTG